MKYEQEFGLLNWTEVKVEQEFGQMNWIIES